MSVPSQTPYNVYTANGLTTVFAYQFMIMNAGDLEVSVNGNPVSSGFTVQGAGQTGGGQVVFITPPDSGAVVMLLRKLAIKRDTDYQDNGDLLADTINADFDRLWLAMQQAFLSDSLSLKRPLLGGDYNAGGLKVIGLKDPTNPQDAATKGWVDLQYSVPTSEAKQAAAEAKEARDESREIADKFGDVDGAVTAANSAKVAAQEAASEASDDADRADNAANRAESIVDVNGTYPDTAAGLAATTSGQYFRIPQGEGSDVSFIYYQNNNGTAIAVAALPGWAAINNILGMINADGVTRTAFMQWFDKNGLVIAKWLNTPDGLAFKSLLLSFGPDGFSAKNAGITASKIFNSFLSIFKINDAEDFVISDTNGLILARVISNMVKLPGFTLNLPFLNLYAKKLNLLPGMTLGADGATITLAGPLQTVDKNGLIAFSQDAKGRVKFSGMDKLGSGGGSSTGAMTEKQVINLLDGTGAAYASKRHNQVRFPVPRGAKLKKLTIWLGYGQSFNVGGGSFFAIPDDIDLGNIMLGQSPRGSTFVKGLSSYDFGAVGGNIFQPLHEVRQTDAGVISETSGSHGQTIAKAFADEVKRRYNERMQKDNDTDVIFGVALCGVAGAPIEDLSKGAAAGYYNRYLTALSGIVQAATAAGYEWEVGGIILNHGEQNNGATAEYYLPYLQTLYGNLIADAMTASGQITTPIFLINQIGNSFISGRNFGVVEAQRQFVENNPLAFMVGSYAGLPNPVDHLFANSYRWLGAQFAKVADRVMWGNDEANFQMVGAYWSGNTVYVGFSTRVPPLTFKSAYVTYNETMYHDKGFTVSDGSGVLTGSNLTVSIVSDNVVKIVAARTLTGTVSIMLGDGTSHAGVHNIADSDTEVSDFIWESGLPGQPATENIASLNNKHYSLANRALIQKITAEEF